MKNPEPKIEGRVEVSVDGSVAVKSEIDSGFKGKVKSLIAATAVGAAVFTATLP